MAREALSNGDKILSENYLQHADHFTRVLNERESYKRDKYSENKIENNNKPTEGSVENSLNRSEENLSDTTTETNKIEENEKPQAEIN